MDGEGERCSVGSPGRRRTGTTGRRQRIGVVGGVVMADTLGATESCTSQQPRSARAQIAASDMYRDEYD